MHSQVLAQLWRCLQTVLVATLLTYGSPGAAAADDANGANAAAKAQERLLEIKRLAEQVQKDRASGDLARAITALEKKIDLEREALGPLHADVADSLEELVDLYLEQSEF